MCLTAQASVTGWLMDEEVHAMRLIYALILTVPCRLCLRGPRSTFRKSPAPAGLTAWLVEEPSIPFVALEIRFRGGASLDASGKAWRHQPDDGLAGRRAPATWTHAPLPTRTEALATSFGFDVDRRCAVDLGPFPDRKPRCLRRRCCAMR